MQHKKIYIDNVSELVEASEKKEKIYIEHNYGCDEIFSSHLFNQEDWLFTIKTLKNVSNGNLFRFFKINF